jgi:hypothetical protein
LEYAGMIEMVCVTPPHHGKRFGRDKYPVRLGFSTRPERLNYGGMIENVSVAYPHGKRFGRDEYPVRLGHERDGLFNPSRTGSLSKPFAWQIAKQNNYYWRIP